MSESNDYPWRDPDLLERMYCEKDMSSTEIGNELGCSHTTVCNWLEKYDIDTDQSSIWISDANTGHQIIRHTVDGKEHTVPVHRLIALLEHDASDLDDNHVHHKNGIPYDNRSENLEVLSAKEHRDRHLGLHSENTPWRNEEVLRDLASEGLSTVEIGEELECSHETVRRWMEKFGIETVYTQNKPWQDAEVLKSLYNSGMSTTEIGDVLECSPQTVNDWMKKFDIDRRSISEAKMVKNK